MIEVQYYWINDETVNILLPEHSESDTPRTDHITKSWKFFRIEMTKDRKLFVDCSCSVSLSNSGTSGWQSETVRHILIRLLSEELNVVISKLHHMYSANTSRKHTGRNEYIREGTHTHTHTHAYNACSHTHSYTWIHTCTQHNRTQHTYTHTSYLYRFCQDLFWHRSKRVCWDPCHQYRWI